MRRSAVAFALFLLAVTSIFARDLPNIDALAGKRVDPNAQASVASRGRDLLKAGSNLSVDSRLGVPTMVWASGATAAPFKVQKPTGTGAETSARAYLAQYASLYGFDPSDASSASLIFVHDLGKGPIIAKFNQHVEGIEIFREEINVMMNQRHDLVAIGGYISGTNTPPAHAGQLSFTLDAKNAAANAYQDLTQLPFDASLLTPAGSRDGYDFYNLPASAQQVEPVRMKKVYFHLPEGLEPGYYIEIAVKDEVASVEGNVHTLDYYSYVVSAVDGRLLFRNNLTVNDEAQNRKNNATKQQTPNPAPIPFTYRVWADVNGVPYDTPAGNGVHPKINATPDGVQYGFVGTTDVTLSNYPFSMNDPWLAPGATETNGNNADAYVDLTSGDGFTPATSDVRGTVTAPNQFLHTHTPDTAVTTAEQRQGAIQQLFFNVNFLHDWYYDSGFNEVARNAQVSNYGRGGSENDGIKAEADDFSGRNNANMSTPVDGARPRMQMYVFDTGAPKLLQTISPAGIAGIQSVGTGQFGAQSFDVTQVVVQPNPVTGCTAASFNDPAVPGGTTGKFVLVNREPTSGTGSCSIGTKLNNAMAATGGPPAGFILVNLSTTPDTLVNVTGSLPTFTIPFLTITWNGAAPIKTQLAVPNVVTLRMVREAGPDRDGTIDNQIVFHEWGHYLSNRLIGNANGLVSTQSRGMGEGWGDFSAMMLTVRPDDPSTPSNATWNGAYALATYATSGGTNGGFNQGYYYGIRRAPYSTDLTKNPLTYKHIANGQAIAGAPLAFGASGSNNAEVHNTGEVWANMLWECYASLLRDTQGGSPRLTFTEAQTRMKAYLVASLKMTTPVNPTFVEARDAVLAAAYATDSVDYLEFWQAFAKRGLGSGATAVANRDSTDNTGITESFVATPELIFDHAVLDDSGGSCDADGVLDAGEGGHITVYLKNTGTTTLTGVTGTLTPSTSGFSLPGGGTLNFPSVDPLSTTSATIAVAAAGSVAGITQADFALQYTHPSLANIPRNATLSFRTNTDVIAANTATDSVESPVTPWTTDFNVALMGIHLGEFKRTNPVNPLNTSWFGPDLGTNSDERLVSPVFTAVGAMQATIQFDHSFGFEFDGGGNYDGGIVEASVNGGAFANIGVAGGLPNYNGTLLVYSGNTNPIQGSSGFVQNSGGTIHSSFSTAMLNPGDTVQFRFRIGSDPSFGAAGWTIDNIQVSGVTNTPFDTVVADTPCNLPTTTSLISAPNPSTFGVNVTFTATVASGGPTPAGNVDFKEGAATLATVPLASGQAQFMTSALSVGTHNIVAVYVGAPGFNPSSSSLVSQVVNKTATSIILSSGSPNPALQGTSLTFNATISATVGTPAGSISFYDGVTLLGSGGIVGGVASYTTSSLAIGSHPISAVYGGNATFLGSTSNTYPQDVTLPALAFATNPLRVLETAGSVNVVVNRTGLLSGASSVHYQTNNGTADSGDFNATSGDLNYAATDTTMSFPITILNDPDTEGVHTFTVTLSAETGATVANHVLTVEIVDDESNFGDVNLDGRADVVWRNEANGQHTLWRMGASGVQTTASIFTFNDPTWHVVASGDFDGDGRTDLFWRQDGTGVNYTWLLNDNNMPTALPQYTVSDTDWKVVGSGDFDADGRADIIWRHATSGAVYVWFMVGGNVSSAVGLPSVPDNGWKIVGVGDFDGDLHADLFWRHSVTGANYVWFVVGTSVTAVGTVGEPDLNWKVSAVGDFDGDGKDDIFWHNDVTSMNYEWDMNGSTPTASLLPNFTGGVTTNAVGSGDFDGDGKDDVLVRETATNNNEAWLMNGTSRTVVALPTFGSATENPVSPK